MVSILISSVVDGGFDLSSLIKPKMMKMIFAAFQILTHNIKKQYHRLGWLKVRIMCQLSGATSLLMDCCFSDLVL